MPNRVRVLTRLPVKKRLPALSVAMNAYSGIRAGC